MAEQSTSRPGPVAKDAMGRAGRCSYLGESIKRSGWKKRRCVSIKVASPSFKRIEAVYCFIGPHCVRRSRSNSYQ